ncbi:MAG: F0F1 ATP synthase subunit B [Planctomycetia bacterium]|nr:F0F1 ATP synthase subunit B [Planctomycetia bacterium]
MKRNNFNPQMAPLRQRTGWMASAFVICLVTVICCFAFANVALASGAAGEEGHAGASLNPLSFKTDLAIWTGVVFLGLVFILGKFAFKPIVKALDDREQSMLDQVLAAEKANADARDLLQQYQQKLSDSEAEVRHMIETARADAEKVAQGIVEKAKIAAENEHQKALKEIESATDFALQELAAKSAGLATTLAGRILKEQIDPAKHSQLINGAIHQFSKN